jgi:hypothetical protein
MRRRAVLRVGGPAVFAALGGCLVGTGEPDVPDKYERLSPAWSQPDSVYYQGHRKGMKMLGAKAKGDRTVGLSYSYAERFWTVTGSETERVPKPDRRNAIHLMASVWDTETKTVLPSDAGLRVRVERDGETLTQRALWPMLSQQMGFHFGDNIAFPEQAQYTLVVDMGTAGVDGVGAFEGAFAEPQTVRFEFPFSRGKRNEIPVSNNVLERRGESAALSPMDMEMQPLSAVPSADKLPGTVVGEASSGDADFVVTAAGVEEGTYLTVSPRTPYNEYPLPLMALSAAIERDGATVFDGTLTPAVGPERGYHYRTVVDSVESGDTLTIRVDSPPQVARHSGYETAFLEMPKMTITA